MEEEALLTYLDTPNFLEAAKTATRLVAKLKSAAQRKELYETHQILRTIYFRFIQSKEKITALVELLYRGSCFLIDLNEPISGQDIASLFIETVAKVLQTRDEERRRVDIDLELDDQTLSYHVSNKTLDWETSDRVANIAVKLPDTELGKTKFIAEALKVLSPRLLNRDLFHHVLANTFWYHKDFASARYHYLYCTNIDNAENVAKFLIDYHNRSASKNEIDLFITQFILQFLCLQSPLDPPKNQNINHNQTTNLPVTANVTRKKRTQIRLIAEKVFSTYSLNHPSLSQVCIPFSSFPLLNFTYFIISIIDKNQESATFTMLCDIYKVTWNRDPNYQSYLNRIGVIYFGLADPTKQQQQQGGLFNNILRSFLDGSDDD